MVKNVPTRQEIWVQSLGQEDPLEKGMAIPFSILAWKIPQTEGTVHGIRLRKTNYPTYIWNLKKKQNQMSKIKTVLQIQRTPRREKRIDKGDEEEKTCSNAVNKS